MRVSDLHNDFFSEGLDFAVIKKDTEKYAKKVVFALYKGNRTLDDIFKNADKVKSLGGNNYRTAFEDIDYIDDENYGRFLSYNPVYMTLTWNFENSLAGGALSGGALKDKGRRMIKRLSGDRIFIDTAHLSEESFFLAAELTDYMINSHTCFKSVCDNPRNITDEQIKIIIEKNGVIGITFVSTFLNGSTKAAADDVVAHIDYFLQKFGGDNLAIGTDFFGTENLPEGIINYKSTLQLVEKLQKKGYNNRVIEKLFFKNADKIFTGERDVGHKRL